MAIKHTFVTATGHNQSVCKLRSALAWQSTATRPMLCKRTAFASCLPTCSMRPGPLLGPSARLPNSKTLPATHRRRLTFAPTSALPAPTNTAATAVTADPWTTLAVLSACAAASQLLESHTRWGELLSAPLLALAAALAAAAVGLLPAVSPIYDAVWRFLMPLAVALYLLENDISVLAKSGRQVLAAFLLGAGTMFAGGLVAWQVMGSAMGQHGAQLASCILASYIGGSVNFAAVAAATQLPPALMPAAIAADNLAMLVLLAALLAAPLQRIGQMMQRQPRLAAAAAGSSAPPPPPTVQQQSRAAAAVVPSKSSKPSSRGALGLDGSPLLTQPPPAAAVAACMEETARGRTTTGSGSSGSSSSSSRKGMHGGVAMGSTPKQYSRSKAFGQLALDGGPLLTPDPSEAAAASPTAGPTAGQPAISSSNGKSSSNGNGNGSSSQGSSQGSSSSSNGGSNKCGGCRGSGVTALDENPLLTRAPAMGDAISTINAAREGKQQLLTPAPPGSKASGSSGSSSSSSDGVVGCGCCDEALDAMAAASGSLPQTSMAAAAAAAAAASSQPSGALALDGGLLMTEEPDSGRMAAAVAAAKTGSKSGSVSISSSALSSLASTDADELELVVKFDIKALQDSLRKQKQQQQQEAAAAAAAAVAGAAKAAAVAEKQPSRLAAASSSSGLVSISGGVLTSSSAAAALAAATAALAASHTVSAWLSAPALQLLLLSGFALGLSVAGNAVHKLLLSQQQINSNKSSIAAAAATSPFAGAGQLGQLLMGLFFATLGASCACPLASLVTAGPLMAFTLLMVLVHWGLLLGVGGGLLQLPINVLVAGSVANVGGPATAAGVVGGKGWGALIQPCLLCGSLGYAVGTAGGLALARCLGVLA